MTKLELAKNIQKNRNFFYQQCGAIHFGFVIEDNTRYGLVAKIQHVFDEIWNKSLKGIIIGGWGWWSSSSTRRHFFHVINLQQFPIFWRQLCVSINHNTQIFIFLKTIRLNPTILRTYYKNILMEKYFVVGFIDVLNRRFGMIINVVFKNSIPILSQLVKSRTSS